MIQTVVMAGEGEYESHVTMRSVAEDLEKKLGHHVTFSTPDVVEDVPDFPLSRFSDLDTLKDADLLVVYTRFRRLPDEQMQLVVDYVERAGPVVGLRTSTHAFHYAEGSPWEQWNDGFGRDVLGTPWVSHHGHSSTTAVKRVATASHEVLEGVDPAFVSPSWLYRVRLEQGCSSLLWGDPIMPESPSEPGPVCWARDGSRRVLYTSLGHPGDFAMPSFRRLLVNAARWCTAPTAS